MIVISQILALSACYTPIHCFNSITNWRKQCIADYVAYYFCTLKENKMKKALFACAAAMLSISSSVQAFESAPSLIFVGSTYSGHEEITRQALNNISKKIKEIDSGNSLFELNDLKFDLAPEAKGLFGYNSKNMVIHGNFSSDFPKQTTVMSLADFWNIKNFADFIKAHKPAVMGLAMDVPSKFA